MLVWTLMHALMKLLSLRMTLALLSHSHEVTGMVHTICSRTNMLRKKSGSHSLMALAQESGLSLSGRALYLYLHLRT